LLGLTSFNPTYAVADVMTKPCKMNFRRAVTVGEKYTIKEENAIKPVGRQPIICKEKQPD